MPALAWSAVLLAMSGQTGSSVHTGGLLSRLFHVHGMTLDVMNFILRRTGHLLAYGLLGVLDFLAVRSGRNGWMLRWSVAATALVAVVAALDEWHQANTPGRDGVFSDVIFDCAAAALAQLVCKRTLH